jgi:chemotaxis protein MotB
MPDGRPAEEAKGKGEEYALLTDPQAALDKIMAVAGSGQSNAQGQAGGSQVNSSTEELAPGFGDPFDPRSWESVPQSEAVAAAEAPVTPRPKSAALQSVDPTPGEAEQVDKAESQKAPSAAGISPASEPDTTAPEVPESQDQVAGPSRVEAIERQILERLGKTKDDLEASLDVRQTPEGILVSLADRHLFGMFRSGSAEPEPKLVELMGAIAAVLQDHGGYLVIRGHTDSTPYRGRKYDNWQLSTSRAHMAQYMLIRGGLDEKRIARVEGVADRQPRRTDDPAAAENRRIDILLGDKP